MRQCGICWETFSDRNQFTAHMVAHHDTPDLEIKCFSCQKNFPTIYRLQSHINWVHTVRPTATCDICGKTCSNKDALQMKDFNKYYTLYQTEIPR